MSDRPYLSIGEVLALLKDEFPDVTISKIRFLESQGLIDPERTPSGYRKFYEADVERLRWILRQQREHFLPLKVIKGRLSEDVGEEAGGGVAAPPKVEAPPEPSLHESPAPAPAPAPLPRSRPPVEALSAGPSGVNLTLEELSGASGLGADDVAELERYGFLAGRPVAGVVYYDEEALIVARLAAGFRRHGIEARHLRAYSNAADREAGLFEQVVTPLLKQRNPQSRRQAVDALAELSDMGAQLRAALVRRALKGLVGG
ncbi:MAG TPA: MerR family transcriptional regulator [Acidimicrobiales bacterium]|nr:MerR family transcriptional regulator [Acidimicrobiales bacterium]